MPSRQELLDIAKQAVSEGDDATAHAAMDLIDKIDSQGKEANPSNMPAPPEIGANGQVLPPRNATYAQPQAEPSTSQKILAGIEAPLTMGLSALPALAGSVVGGAEDVGHRYASLLGLADAPQSGFENSHTAQRIQQFTKPFVENASPLAKKYMQDIGNNLDFLNAFPATAPELQALQVEGSVPNAFRATASGISDLPNAYLPSKAELPIIPYAVKAAPDMQAANLVKDIAKAGNAGEYAKVASQFNADTGVMDSLNQLGISTDIVPAAAITKDQRAHELAGALAANPASIASDELIRYSKMLGDKADEIIQQGGGSIDKAAANDQIRSSLQSEIDNLKSQSSNLYKQIDEKVGNPVINAKPILSYIQKEASKSRAGVDGLDPVYRHVFDKVKDGKINYFDLDNLRKEIGAAKSKETQAFPNSTQAKLSDMYGKLTTLQGGVADQAGGASGLWSQAKALEVKKFGLQDAMQIAFNRELGGSVITKAEQAIQTASKGDIGKLRTVLDGLPEEQQKTIMATALNSVFSNTKSIDKAYSANQLSSFGKNLERSPTTQKLLKDYLGDDTYNRLQAMIDVSHPLANIQRNITKTGIIPDELKKFQNTSGIAGALFRVAGVADKIPFVGKSVSVPSNVGANLVEMSLPKKAAVTQIADEMLASKEFKDALLSNASGFNKDRIAESNKLLSKSKVMAKYLASVPKEKAAVIQKMGLINYLSQQAQEQDQ